MVTPRKKSLFQSLTPHLKAAVHRLKAAASPSRLSPSHPKPSTKSTPTFIEKRLIEERVPVKIPVRYMPVKGDKELELRAEDQDKVQVTYSKNLSSGGMFLVTKNELFFDSLLLLNVFLPSSGTYLSALAKVMWTDKEGAGLAFVEMNFKNLEKLKNYLKEVKGQKSQAS